MKTEAVLFDLDGTLVHTSPAYIDYIMKKCCAQTGIEPTRENIEKIWFGAIPEKDRFMLHHGIEPMTFWKKFVELDSTEERMKYLKLYEDCKALKGLAEKGIKLGLVTNALFHMAEYEIGLLRSAGIDFGAVIIAVDKDLNIRYKPKPNPEGILECMKMLGVRNGGTLFVGDGPDDAAAASAAGIKYVRIDRGEHLIDIEATLKIKSLNELLQMIE